MPTNALGQPVGVALDGWVVPPLPVRAPLAGRWCRLEPLETDLHATSLFSANARDGEGRNWTYLPYGPFPDFAAYRAWVQEASGTRDPLFYAIIEPSGQAVGVASYLRLQPAQGSLEIGHLNFSPLLQRTPAATETLYLLLARAFELGYRRVEWKCDALNAPSRAAAQRLGLSFEGVFVQAAVVKGRNRDTAWYAAIDRDWPALREALGRWLDPANFDPAGRQRTRLSALTAPLLRQRG